MLLNLSLLEVTKHAYFSIDLWFALTIILSRLELLPNEESSRNKKQAVVTTRYSLKTVHHHDEESASLIILSEQIYFGTIHCTIVVNQDKL